MIRPGIQLRQRRVAGVEPGLEFVGVSVCMAMATYILGLDAVPVGRDKGTAGRLVARFSGCHKDDSGRQLLKSETLRPSCPTFCCS